MGDFKRDGIGMTSRRTRDRMLGRLQDLGIVDERVLAAMSNSPRHLFVDEGLATRAYEDTALPIGHRQTISQPYIVARMSELLIAEHMPARVLEIGTGSGYQAAVLNELGIEVYTVERIEPLMRQAKARLWELGYRKCHVRMAGVVVGWPEKAPFDAIIMTAGADEMPGALYDQLDIEGRIVAPVGQGEDQQMVLITKTADGLSQQALERVNFVPLILQ
jgi:protein-L-isoaspartate(D-aspartate) O-methyltransferase